jgi:hypothetical protein
MRYVVVLVGNLIIAGILTVRGQMQYVLGGAGKLANQLHHDKTKERLKSS